MNKRVNLGERNLTTMTGYKVIFDSTSLVKIYKMNELEEVTDLVMLDPTDISIIYSAYMQMKKEELSGETKGANSI